MPGGLLTAPATLPVAEEKREVCRADGTIVIEIRNTERTRSPLPQQRSQVGGVDAAVAVQVPDFEQIKVVAHNAGEDIFSNSKHLI